MQKTRHMHKIKFILLGRGMT